MIVVSMVVVSMIVDDWFFIVDGDVVVHVLMCMMMDNDLLLDVDWHLVCLVDGVVVLWDMDHVVDAEGKNEFGERKFKTVN